MHFSKTYAQLQAKFPPNLKENTVKYRQLKKLINQIVEELSTIGLNPSILKHAVQSQSDSNVLQNDQQQDDSQNTLSGSISVIYEFVTTFDSVQPRLRLSRKRASSSDSVPRRHSVSSEVTESDTTSEAEDENRQPEQRHSLIWMLQSGAKTAVNLSIDDNDSVRDDYTTDANINTNIHLANDAGIAELEEQIIPLVSDAAFFQLLTFALESVSEGLKNAQHDFATDLHALSYEISLTAQPVSATMASRKCAYSPKDPANLVIKPFKPSSNSDLYYWREVFQLYVDSEIFESVREKDRGARTMEDVETRLQAFAERVTHRGLEHRLRLPGSQRTLEKFLELNVFILNVKRFEYANFEAVRKILKKHTKRTSLPLPTTSIDPTTGAPRMALLPTAKGSLPHILIQAVGQTLLPIIPHIDDYSCLICTSIAFKPIRLDCGHLFCVRCLVKMQKRGKDECPLCREKVVLKANRSNLDISLLNFMADWFPEESKEKLKANEKDATNEQAEEMGWDDSKCTIC